VCPIGTRTDELGPSTCAAWYDGDLYFQCGPNTRKARNIAANPACTMSSSLPGMDLVFEGEARRVADTPTLAAIAALYRESGWPV
jgi:pyridoxamine 5'-phosphate oxidase-like protein